MANEKIFIDCGGYDGCSVRKFRAQYDPRNQFEIVTFEPNILFNDYYKDFDKHTLINAAVSISDSTQTFYLDTFDYDGSSLHKTKKNIIKPKPIKVKTLDFIRWIKYLIQPNTTLWLKLDIEGSEYDILEKLIEQGLIKHIDRLFIEFHSHKLEGEEYKHRHTLLLDNLKRVGLKPESWDALSYSEYRQDNLLSIAKEEFSVIIRTTGERTLDACRNYLLDYFDDVAVIRDAPFEKTYQRFIKEALHSPKEFILSVDADVLPYQYFAKEIVRLVSVKYPFDFLAFSCRDKFLNCIRPVGVRVYTQKGIKEISKNLLLEKDLSEGEYRLESKNIKAAIKRDSTLVYKETLKEVGMHDFQQYYRDIYRKGVFHAKKHANFIDHHKGLKLFWEAKQEEDKDYLVFNLGFKKGQELKSKLICDCKLITYDPSAIFEEFNIEEKTPFDDEL